MASEIRETAPPPESQKDQDLRAKGVNNPSRRSFLVNAIKVIGAAALLAGTGKLHYHNWQETHKEKESEKLINVFDSIYDEYRELTFLQDDRNRLVTFGFVADNTEIYLGQENGLKAIQIYEEIKDGIHSENYTNYTIMPSGKVYKINRENTNADGEPQSTKLTGQEIDQLALQLEESWNKSRQDLESQEPIQPPPQPKSKPEINPESSNT